MISREHSSFYIGGAWRPARSNAVFEVVSPSSEERIGSVAAASPDDIDAAVAAARHAFDNSDWSRRPPAERGELCARLAEAIARRSGELAELFTEETGSPIMLSRVYQAVAPSVSLNYYARLASTFRFEEVRISDLSPLAGGSSGGSIIPFGGKSLVVQESAGVVAAFTAYNFALACFAQKSAPALVAGCTVVVKVPEQNPLSSFVLAELADEAGFPPGVLNFVAAGPAAAEHLVRHAGVDMVSFTGSTAVERRIGEICGGQIKRAVLELGGKSAAIIGPDADLDLAIPTLVGCSVGTNTGQSCVAMSRILTPAARYAEIADRFAELISALQVGDPMDPDTVIGPLVSAADAGQLAK